MSKKRCFFVGIDGGDWDILEPLMEQGLMPNLKRAGGSRNRGVLHSTLPSLTAPAWSSLLTGSNPGKHGVFFWQNSWQPGQRRELLTNKDVKIKQLPEILNQNQLKVGMINFPMTYPVSPLKGFLVSGMLSPKLDQRSIYPKKIIPRLKKVRYQINVRARDEKKDLKSYFSRLEDSVKQRTKVFLELSQEFETDFSSLVYVGLDRIQHQCYGLLYRSLAQEKPLKTKANLLREALGVYRAVDRGIGEIMEEMGNNDLLIIASDHGFQASEKSVNINRILIDARLLKPKLVTELAYFAFGFLRRFSWAKRLKKGLIDLFRPDRKGLKEEEYQNRRLADERGKLEAINLLKSKAFSGLSSEQGIYLMPGLKTKEKKETVIRIIKALKEARDPQTNQPIFKKVLPRKKAYWGQYTNLAPAVVFSLQPKYKPACPFLLKSPLVETIPAIMDGDHRQEGIFALWSQGREVKLNRREGQIWDILPTILNFFDLPHNKELDGKSLLN